MLYGVLDRGWALISKLLGTTFVFFAVGVNAVKEDSIVVGFAFCSSCTSFYPLLRYNLIFIRVSVQEPCDWIPYDSRSMDCTLETRLEWRPVREGPTSSASVESCGQRSLLTPQVKKTPRRQTRCFTTITYILKLNNSTYNDTLFCHFISREIVGCYQR